MATRPPKTTLAGHTAGIFADMTLDGPEIGTLVAVVDRAKNLPNRKTMGKQDPYCAMRLGKEAKKTETDRRGGQTPKWDQELRFTVHDSPDYYKLKISVFNDDKKTDLIGEAFVDLRDLIKPGGGSNDLWHQLNYKGKYAGEIRMEMTYYDTRPREEKPVERRRQKDKAGSVTSDARSAVSGPRQLGPREVKRRPLPASPGTQPAASPSPSTTPQGEPPQPPPKIPLPQTTPAYGSYVTDQHAIGHQSATEHTRQSPVERYGCDPGPHIPYQPDSQHYEHEALYDDYHQQETQHDHIYPEQFRNSANSSRSLPSARQSISQPVDGEFWDESQRRHSENFVVNEAPSAYSSPPPMLTSNSAPEVPQYRPYRASGSPTKMLHYRDSPLRHSMSQQEVQHQFEDEPESFDEPPPPPPKHRETTPRRSPVEYPPSAYAPTPLRPTPRRPSIDERSPLQNIERDFDPYSTPVHTPSRQSSYDVYAQPTTGSPHSVNAQDSFDAFPQASASSPHASEMHGSYSATDQQRSVVLMRPHGTQDPIDVYGRRNSRNAFVQEIPAQKRPVPHRERSGSYDDRPSQHSYGSENFGIYNSSPHARSQPNLPDGYDIPSPARSVPQKVIPTQSPSSRKAISPGPYPEMGGHQLSGIPFGPDSYNVLNPVSSPTTNENTVFETQEQSKEAARLREVAKLRDQGPIIGNDGRVIDPSDHLPSDTWAPEPERKQRKPEHVIHVRTKKDSRPRITPGSSPVSPHIRGPQAYPQSSPINNSPGSAPSSTRRYTHQTSTPTRPLPTQPYQQPSRPVSNNFVGSPNQEFPRKNSYYDVSPTYERPALSEYQVPAANSYSPRGQNYQTQSSYQQTPPKTPYVEDYTPHGYDDPLIAEMNMIDIGPSKSNRSLVRSSRGY